MLEKLLEDLEKSGVSEGIVLTLPKKIAATTAGDLKVIGKMSFPRHFFAEQIDRNTIQARVFLGTRDFGMELETLVRAKKKFTNVQTITCGPTTLWQHVKQTLPYSLSRLFKPIDVHKKDVTVLTTWV